MNARIEKGNLIITIPLEAPRASASGKTRIVATSGGNRTFPDVKVDGQPVVIGLNAYIK